MDDEIRYQVVVFVGEYLVVNIPEIFSKAKLSELDLQIFGAKCYDILREMIKERNA